MFSERVSFLAFVVSVPLLLLFITALEATRRRRPANRYLMVVLTLILMLQIILRLKVTGDVEQWPYLLRLPPVIYVAVGTFLYLYLQKFTDPRFHWRNLPPGYWAPLGFMAACYLLSVSLLRDLLPWTLSPEFLYERWVGSWIVIPLFAFFVFKSLHALHVFERALPDLFSRHEMLSVWWLRTFVFSGLVFVVGGVVDALLGPEVVLWEFAMVAWSLVTCVLAYLTIRYSPMITLELVAVAAAPPGARPTPTSSPELLARRERVLAALEAEGLYRKPDLRLSDLATASGLRPNQVTEVLSHSMGTTFYELVNRMRLEEAKRRLRDPEYAHMNILGIASDSGFNSKSVFNDAFKKATGVTPSQFRNGHAKEPDRDQVV